MLCLRQSCTSCHGGSRFPHADLLTYTVLADRRKCVKQFRTLFGKFFIMYWRSPSYNATRFVMTVRVAGCGSRTSCRLRLTCQP